jgi:AcrR family transcriptional regulator
MVDKKDYIMDIAKEKFDRFGFKKTTVDEICQDARISKKTLYEYFKDKEDLFVSLFMREALASRKVVLGRLKNIDDPLEKIKKFFRFAGEYFKKEPFMVKVLEDENGLFAPFLKKKYRTFVEEGILDVIADIIKEGIKKGKFRNIDPHITAYIIFKLFQAFTYAKTIPSRGRRKSERKELNELLRFLSEALNKK